MSGRATADVGVVTMRTLTCEQCGMDWQRPAMRGRPPKRCPECKPVVAGALPRSASVNRRNRIDTNTAGYRMAAAVTTYRLAIEEATSALLLGKNDVALAALRRVQAPARLAGRPVVIDLTAVPDRATTGGQLPFTPDQR